MARRSDHSRDELEELIVNEGHRQISEAGYANFSARKLAKKIGYTVGTIYHVFGSLDHLMLAINGRTVDKWHHYLSLKLEAAEGDRLQIAVEAYFEFAIVHRHSWLALMDFRLPEDQDLPESYVQKVAGVMALVGQEVAEALPDGRKDEAGALTRSLLATVHGHCFFTLNGTFDALGESEPVQAALARVRDAVR